MTMAIHGNPVFLMGTLSVFEIYRPCINKYYLKLIPMMNISIVHICTIKLQLTSCLKNNRSYIDE